MYCFFFSFSVLKLRSHTVQSLFAMVCFALSWLGLWESFSNKITNSLKPHLIKDQFWCFPQLTNSVVVHIAFNAFGLNPLPVVWKDLYKKKKNKNIILECKPIRKKVKLNEIFKLLDGNYLIDYLKNTSEIIFFCSKSGQRSGKEV